MNIINFFCHKKKSLHMMFSTVFSLMSSKTCKTTVWFERKLHLVLIWLIFIASPQEYWFGCNQLLNSKEGAAIFHYSVKMFHLLLNHAHYFGEIKYPKSFPKPVLCSWVNNNSRQHLAKNFQTAIQFFPQKLAIFLTELHLFSD